MNKKKSPLEKTIYELPPWVLLIVGFISLIIGFVLKYKFECQIWADVLITIGNVVSISGIFGFLVSYGPIKNSYRDELIDLLHEKKYIKKLVNKEGLWKCVTKVLIKERFHNIHESLFDIITNIYLPTNKSSNNINDISYYENHEMIFTLEWQDEDRGIIKIINDISFNLITENKGATNYTQTCDIEESKKDEYYKAEFTDTKVDGVKVDGKIVTKSENGKYKCDHILELKGKTKYRIDKKATQVFDLNKERVTGFEAQYITNGCIVQVHVNDKNIGYVFTKCGTINDFEEKKINAKCFRYENKSLILPFQGYTIYIYRSCQ